MKHHPTATGRRAFLQNAARLSALAGTPFAANLLGVASAAAQSSTDYKALVCVYMAGGNDQSNLLIPTSTSEYNAYATGRTGLALQTSTLRGIAPLSWAGPPLAFHASLANLVPLFAQQRMAVLANVGTLVQPTTRAQWQNASVPMPSQLFSHADQAAAWQTGLPDKASSTGWLGRMGDLTATSFNPGSGVSIAMSIAGNNVMQAGDKTIQYQLTTNGAVRVSALDNLYGQSAGASAVNKLMTESRSLLLESELNRVSKRAVDTERIVTSALSTVNVKTAFPGTDLASQLRMVARMIGARSALSQRRQIFFVQAGGYDFHDNLINDQSSRLKDLGDAMAAFYSATVELGVSSQVTAFTASDFGRPLQSNGRGSDHGWGAHHLVVGGAVRGQKVYGKWPQVAINGAEDAGQGRLIPTTAVDQYASTLARWFGVSPTDMPIVLPNIGRFATSDLGFLA